jgi:dishevelled associated activator of morphogenesis
LNLDEFQKTFSAYQKSNENDSLTSTIVTSNSQHSLNNNFRSLENITKVKTTRKEFSVIDFTRGRNLTILLSKLKMTTNELKNILLNFDDEDELPRDMIEQLLKFIPTVEEETLLEDNLTELTNMAKADRFLFEVSKIYRYKQKLETLLFKKRFLERYKEIGQLIDKIIKCCQILKSSKNVMQMLEIVLAMGNFMNQSSKKGVAVGFSIANLNKLIDIKSANDRSFSLLHFLVTTIQDKVMHFFFVKIFK